MHGHPFCRVTGTRLRSVLNGVIDLDVSIVDGLSRILNENEAKKSIEDPSKRPRLFLSATFVVRRKKIGAQNKHLIFFRMLIFIFFVLSVQLKALGKEILHLSDLDMVSQRFVGFDIRLCREVCQK